jgi:hypothetical protein
MQDGQRPSLEKALAKTEAAAEGVLRAASAVTSALKRFRGAAHVGNMRDLRTAIAAADQALVALRQQFANARDGWDFDEEAYFEDGSFAAELLETAKRLNLGLFQLDERLYSYPVLVRLLPSDRSVMIDKTRERRVRPTILVSHLRELQRRPPRFRPEAFLEALHDAYTAIAARRQRGRPTEGTVVRLVDVYDLFTLLPGQSKEYSRQEFARDIYLLDQSGVTTTRRGSVVSLPASTGTRSAGSTIRVITQDGQEKAYFGLAFTAAG